MLQIITEPVLDKLPRLNSSDLEFNIDKIRLQELSNGLTLIFFDDFDYLNESNLASVMLHYNLDPDKVGLVIDEVKIIKSPYIYKKAKNVINPSKIYIRRINTSHLSHLVEEAIQEFIQTNNWDLFDRIINSSFSFSEDATHWFMQRAMATTLPIQNKLKTRAQNAIHSIKNTAQNYGKTAAMVGGGLLAAHLASDHITKTYANNDYATPPQERSQLIAKLRTLVGKSAAYESEYEKANEQRKGVLRRILDKIKSIIRAIRNKLFGNSSNMGGY